jgi:hypothetical protein
MSRLEFAQFRPIWKKVYSWIIKYMKRVIGIKTVATILCFEDFNRLCLISKNKIIIEKQNEI